jgi:hypothetical protein
LAGSLGSSRKGECERSISLHRLPSVDSISYRIASVTTEWNYEISFSACLQQIATTLMSKNPQGERYRLRNSRKRLSEHLTSRIYPSNVTKFLVHAEG